MKRWLTVLFFLPACTLQPPYHRPQMELYPIWRVPTPEQNEICNMAWWDRLEDPLLNGLIEAALANNQDLKVAIFRVDEFAANLGIVRSNQFPQISGTFGAEREKISTTLQPVVSGIGPSTFNAFGFILNASYQLDLWGQLQSATDAAYAELFAQVQNRRNVVLTLVGAVAKAYIELKQYQLSLQISEETLKTREVSYELSKIRYGLGLTSEMQMDQALSEVQSAETQVLQFQLAAALQEDLISFLIGTPSHKICGGKLLCQLCMPPCIPAAAPCELLNQRPDILAAEQNLLAANANIGVARALFLPDINLFAAIDTESSFWRSLFNGPSSTWDYGITIMQEIFTGGRLTSNLWETYAIKLELVHQYESTVLNAVKEVNDALISHKINLNLVETQKERVATLAEYYRLSNLRYVEGLTDYLTVLDAERQLFRAQLDLAQFQADSFTSLVDIYTSLGGGWVCEADAFSQCMNCR